MKIVMSAAVAAAMLSTAASAHHSHPDFAMDQDATVEGTIESIEFENPDVVIRLRTADAVIYTLEWQGAAWLANEPRVFVSPVPGAITADTLKRFRRSSTEWTRVARRRDSIALGRYDLSICSPPSV